MVVIFSSPPPVPSVLSSHLSPFLLLRRLLLTPRCYVSLCSLHTHTHTHSFSSTSQFAACAICLKPTLNLEACAAPVHARHSYPCNPYVSKSGSQPVPSALIQSCFTAVLMVRRCKEDCRESSKRCTINTHPAEVFLSKKQGSKSEGIIYIQDPQFCCRQCVDCQFKHLSGLDGHESSV